MLRGRIENNEIRSESGAIIGDDKIQSQLLIEFTHNYFLEQIIKQNTHLYLYFECQLWPLKSVSANVMMQGKVPPWFL